MIISFTFLHAKYLRTSLLVMRTRSFLTLLYVGGAYSQGQRGGHFPSTCTAATLCDGDHGLRLTTSTVVTMSPRGEGSAVVGRTPTQTPT